MSMQHLSTLMRAPFFREVAEKLAELEDAAGAIGDAISDYESAADEPSREQTELREHARDALHAALGDWCTTAAELIAMRARIEEAVES